MMTAIASAAAAALGAGGTRGTAYAFYAALFCFADVRDRNPQNNGENDYQNKIFHR